MVTNATFFRIKAFTISRRDLLRIKEFYLNTYTKRFLHFYNISHATSYKLVNLIDNPFVDLLRHTTILNETYCRSKKRSNISPVPPLRLPFKILCYKGIGK